MTSLLVTSYARMVRYSFRGEPHLWQGALVRAHEANVAV